MQLTRIMPQPSVVELVELGNVHLVIVENPRVLIWSVYSENQHNNVMPLLTNA